jgi:hypothetical protein
MADTFSGFYSSHGGGADYDFVVRRLSAIFREEGITPPHESPANQQPVPVRAVGLIFGRPACKVFKEELLPDRGYHNLRSGRNVELFYMGFADPDEEYLPVGVFDDDGFSQESFVSSVDDFESRTEWHYSGATDLILLNSWFSPKGKVYLDFSCVLALTLEEVVESKLVKSARSLIEEIIRQSTANPGTDVVMKVSDAVFLKSARNSLLTWAMGIIKLKPEDLGNAYRSCVRDVSRPARS